MDGVIMAENWDTIARAEAVANAKARPSGKYRVKISYADGPSKWEIADFDNATGEWRTEGGSRPKKEVCKPFSNAWEIDEKKIGT